jgi:ribonucleoside-diphosphate reductase alpha chain
VVSDDVLKLLREKKYFKEGESSWEDIADRVSTAVASAEIDPVIQERVKRDVYKALINLDFVFSTPTLLNADVDDPGQLSSCFILSLKDDIESIGKCDIEYMKIFQKNGGAGLDMSPLRPARSPVNTSRGYAGGVVAFMYKFDMTADIMTRNNPARKGAIKKDLQVWHPDIYDFIHAKDDTSKLTRMNISTSLTDEFMEAVQDDTDWKLEFPDLDFNKEVYNAEWDGDLQQWKAKGYPTTVYKVVKARELFRGIAKAAWETGEPGINFRDRMKLSNKNTHITTLVGSNPCSEFTNIPYSSCNLASVNIKNYVKLDGSFDFDRLSSDMIMYVRWMDNTITINKLPLDEIAYITKGIRPIGIGIMGFADALILMGVRYDSKRARDFAEKINRLMYKQAVKASIELAIERGEYPLWEGSDWHREGIKIRNSNFISIAPTGTISFIAGVSGGIEPLYALVYTRVTYDGTVYYIVNKEFKEKLIDLGIYSDELMQKVVANHGSCQGIPEIPKSIQNLFVTAHDIRPSDHVSMLGAVQKNVDLSVSKTVNFLSDATIEDIENIFMEAYKLKCKGLTVYRDGSRANQTLAVTRGTKAPNVSSVLQWGDVIPAPDEAPGMTCKLRSGCGNLYLTANWNEQGNIVQTFVDKGSAGTCRSNQEAVSRMTSLALRAGVPIEKVIDQLNSVSKCNSYTNDRIRGSKVSEGTSCPSAIACKLKVKRLLRLKSLRK